MNRYWQGHDTEPFNEYWWNPSNLHKFNWNLNTYFVTSISCPYCKNREHQIPKYEEFITTVKKYCNIIIAIIGRDRTILKYEQTRVRESHTTPIALEQFKYLYTLDPYFLSMELVFLYRENYLKQVGRDLGFPIIDGVTPPLFTDSNKQYIHEIGEQPLDKEIKKESLEES